MPTLVQPVQPFFPSISLTATAGSLSGELSDLFWFRHRYLVVPAADPPADLQCRPSESQSGIQRKSRKTFMSPSMKKAIQTAFQEVADGLVARKTYADQLAAQEQLLASSQAYLELADRRYREGIDNQLTLLDAQRLNFNAKTAENQHSAGTPDQRGPTCSRRWVAALTIKLHHSRQTNCQPPGQTHPFGASGS
jgi:outer membrane protein TolC